MSNFVSLIFTANMIVLFLSKTKNVLQSPFHLKKIFDESGRKSNKIWLDQGNGFYNRSIKSWLHDSGTEMYSTHNEGKNIC